MLGVGLGWSLTLSEGISLLSSLFQLQRHLSQGLFWSELFLTLPVLLGDL